LSQVGSQARCLLDGMLGIVQAESVGDFEIACSLIVKNIRQSVFLLVGK
jgi:hypothetical protein